MAGTAPTVYLLGAGFARAIHPGMPLLQDLGRRVAAPRETPAVPADVRRLMGENFAHALSYLEQSKPWLDEAENLRHRALFLEISAAIARDLERTVQRADAALTRAVPGWIGMLVRHWHETRATVISLNYDTLVESIAARVPLPDGESISAGHLYPAVLTDAGLRSGAAEPEPRRESFRLLKLHGSTNWFYSGRTEAHGEPIYFVPPTPADRRDEHAALRHEQRLRAVADKYPFLVPPVYDKSPLLTHETIRALWFEAGKALQDAERLVCLGYSLPPSDLTMMHFLRAMCGNRLEIEIVNRSAEAVRHFARLFERTRVRVTQACRGRGCIAAFVSRLGAVQSPANPPRRHAHAPPGRTRRRRAQRSH